MKDAASRGGSRRPLATLRRLGCGREGWLRAAAPLSALRRAIMVCLDAILAGLKDRSTGIDVPYAKPTFLKRTRASLSIVCRQRYQRGAFGELSSRSAEDLLNDLPRDELDIHVAFDLFRVRDRGCGAHRRMSALPVSGSCI